MATRRVVTGIKDGRSIFLSDGPVEPSQLGLFEDLWTIKADDQFGHAPVAGEESLVGAAGSLTWRVVTIPSDADYVKMLAAAPPERKHLVDPDGWHQTTTVDLVLVLEGDLALQLDEGEVLLHPGDVVIQQGTNHAWHTRSEGPVRVLAMMRNFP
jgi:mannose-6-phosphate isomerase-like protein (cupin superfamily)